MYERFSDRARYAMHCASQETLHLNQDSIGTEHILLGLIGAGESIAGHILKQFDVTPERVRTDVLSRLESKSGRPRTRRLPQTPNTKKVIEYALEETRNLEHGYVGTEHLLLGLLRETEGIAAAVLQEFGLTLDEVRRRVIALDDIRSEWKGLRRNNMELETGPVERFARFLKSSIQASSPK